jgi:C4-type Zn-finger protein
VKRCPKCDARMERRPYVDEKFVVRYYWYCSTCGYWYKEE